MTPPPLIWALLDERPGNATQVIGLAERLGGTIVEKPLELTPWVRLANVIVQDRLWGITPESRASLEGPPWPDVAIAAGRRLAPVLLHLKKTRPALKIVQLMAPGLSEKRFDWVIVPSHDRREQIGNRLVTLGAPNRVTPAKLAAQAAKWRLRLHLRAPVTTLLVGGGTAVGQMTLADAEAMWQQLAPLRQGSLLVTTSRRTSPLVTAFLKEHVKPPHRLFLFGEAENPYLAFLGLADRIVVTVDSVSMLSEACVIGKPVYGFVPGEAMKSKHWPFLRELIAAGHLRMLADFDPAWTGPGLQGEHGFDEAGRVAAILKAAWGWGATDPEAPESSPPPRQPSAPLRLVR